MRMAPKIIQFARLYSHTCRRRNSHQLLLFPNSSKANHNNNAIALQPEATDINTALIEEYKGKNDNWYPFYFSDCQMFIDNHHLQLFKSLPPLPYEQVGKTTCFGEFVQCSSAGNSQNNDQGILFLGTETGSIIIVSQLLKIYHNCRLPLAQTRSIKFVHIYEDTFIAFTHQIAHIYKWQISTTERPIQATNKQS